MKTAVIDMQQIRKYLRVLEPLLGSGSRATLEVLLEAVFSRDPRRGYVTQPTELVQWSADRSGRAV
jgi:hypothetical protein